MSCNFSRALFSVLSKLVMQALVWFRVISAVWCGLFWHFIHEYKTSSHLSTTFKKKNLILHSSKYGTTILKTSIVCFSGYLTLNNIY